MGKVLTKAMWNLSQFSDVDFAIKDMFFFKPERPVGGANFCSPNSSGWSQMLLDFEF